MDVEVVIERVYLPTEALGSFYINGKLMSKTMELPWKDNQRSISCIPEGVYEVIKQPPKADRPYPYFRFVNVPGRSGILIHKITYVSGLKGCIGVGKQHFDIDGDGVPDIIQSGAALTELINVLPEKFTILIKQKGK